MFLEEDDDLEAARSMYDSIECSSDSSVLGAKATFLLKHVGPTRTERFLQSSLEVAPHSAYLHLLMASVLSLKFCK